MRGCAQCDDDDVKGRMTRHKRRDEDERRSAVLTSLAGTARKADRKLRR